MTTLHIASHAVGDVTVVTLKGAVTFGEGDLTLRTTIRDLVEKGSRKLVLDLEGVPYMDSTGLGELVASYASARNRGAEIRLANLLKRIEDLMGVVQLLGLFETFPSVDEAVKSFG